jgi:CheY-like chemotaxis protein
MSVSDHALPSLKSWILSSDPAGAPCALRCQVGRSADRVNHRARTVKILRREQISILVTFDCLSGRLRKAMPTFRILMIEDTPWVGFVLEELIAEAVEAEITVLRSVADGQKALANSKFDFAFLDVNVTDGKTYSIATSLMNDQVPFAFMSGYMARDEMPEGFRHAMFVKKPYRPDQIKSILDGLLPSR